MLLDVAARRPARRRRPGHRRGRRRGGPRGGGARPRRPGPGPLRRGPGHRHPPRRPRSSSAAARAPAWRCCAPRRRGRCSSGRGHALPEDVRALAHHRAVAPAHPDARRARPRRHGRRTSWRTRSTRCPSRCDLGRGARRGARSRSSRPARRPSSPAAASGRPPSPTLGVGLIALPVLVTVLVGARRRRAATWSARSRPARTPRRRRPSDGARRAPRAGPPGSASTGCSRCAIDPGLGGRRRRRRRARAEGRRLDAARRSAATTCCRRRSRRSATRSAWPGAPAAARGADAAAGAAGRARRWRASTLGARSAGHAGSRRSADSGFGELDRVRDYQPGDALSRIHWAPDRQARPPADQGAAGARRARAARWWCCWTAPCPPGDDFETAVTAAAALCRHLAERGDPVALAATGPRAGAAARARPGWPAMELALARVAGGGDRALGLALRAELAAPDAPDLMIVVTARRATRRSCRPSARAARRGRRGGRRARRARPPRSSAELEAGGADVAVVPGAGPRGGRAQPHPDGGGRCRLGTPRAGRRPRPGRGLLVIAWAGLFEDAGRRAGWSRWACSPCCRRSPRRAPRGAGRRRWPGRSRSRPSLVAAIAARTSPFALIALDGDAWSRRAARSCPTACEQGSRGGAAGVVRRDARAGRPARRRPSRRSWAPPPGRSWCAAGRSRAS